MFYDINKNLCEMYPAINPLTLLDYPAEDVFTLINETIDYNSRNRKNGKTPDANGNIRRAAGDNWF